MSEAVKKIAVVQGMQGAVVQDLFRVLAARWQGCARLAGVIAEDHGLPGRACSAGYLRSLASGERFAIFQDLGPGSAGCHLAGDGALAAAAAVRRDIATGCDLVLLSKFGKLEANGGGLRDAFGAAIEAQVPVLTSVSPAQLAAWKAFAAPLFTVVPADADRIDAWRRSVRPPNAPHAPEPATAGA
ncbi:DUF2478 domain-containing protein [Vineibacter terrae]|uniref:DUF2478 domain-containing protein n=1 Tax=Vineibacter terrae TaxID=2586908 RepID=A0A5C8PBD0_9HYPH|nr:DUF2478 domain-containing protein [Vineibacter terrae]TXL71114.1 DUF2478 domain-containing protein [Vineibacter terrae]